MRRGYARCVRAVRRFVLLAIAAGPLFAGCYSSSAPPETVAIVGNLWDRDANEGIVNADYLVTSRDGSSGLSAGITGDFGFFVAGGLEKRIPVALTFDRTGYTPAVFTGDTASRDSFLFFPTVYLERTSVTRDFIADYAAAASLSSGELMVLGSGGGAIVRGFTRRLVSVDPLEFEEVAGVQIDILDGEGTSYRVFYGVDGEVAPEATETGDGSFAAFAVLATGDTLVLGNRTGTVTVRATTDDGTVEESTLVIEAGITELDFFTVP